MLERSIEVMTSANRSRKYDSGSQKRKNKQRLDDLTQSQKGAMDRFIVKKSQVSSNNQIFDQNPTLDSNVACLNPTLDFRTGLRFMAARSCWDVELQMQRAGRNARRPFPVFSGYRSRTSRTVRSFPKQKPRHARAATAWQMEATTAAAMIARLLC